ncbi:MAG: hypothetical protein FWG16_07405, partial [Micrococcales bacterium]|nr:hypothetical protein [Micrococcales bacterium]
MEKAAAMGFDLEAATESERCIANAVRDRGPLTRQDLAAITGLSMATINRVGAALMKRQVLATGGSQASTGGRPAELLVYHGGVMTVAGISVDEERASGIIMGLDGQVTDRAAVEFVASHPNGQLTPEDRLDQ